MRLAIWIAWALLLTPAWPQHVRRSVEAARITAPAARGPRPVLLRNHPPGQAAVAAAPAITQAPGVVQTNLLDASNLVWFVTTERLPRGTRISPFMLQPDGSEIPLDAVALTEDVGPGQSFDLPSIRRFSTFWPQGLLTYGVVVTTNGADTQTAADFPVGVNRNYDDLTMMVPRIASLEEGLSERDVLLSIRGAFTSDPAYVVLETLVAPRSAVQVSPTELVVNLSKVPGLDLGTMQELLLTVGQSGWCDTMVFRHAPPRPGTYNPAPL